MNTLVLNSGDAVVWNRYISEICDADIYYRAEYCKIYEENGEGLARLFIYEEGDLFVCYPFLLRSIDHLPAVQEAGFREPLYDIVTPYGYGGPLSNINCAEARSGIFQRFSEQFSRYCIDQRIVSEFVRFHPILNNVEHYQSIDSIFLRNTVCLRLQEDEDIIVSRYKPENRNRIRRAIKEGLSAVYSPPDRIEHLLKLYYSTMDRNHAQSYYYFSESFFGNTVQFLKGNIDLIEIKHQDQVIASCLFMHYGKYVHYHLLGCDQEYLKLGPINLLIHELMLWAKRNGCEYLHLGGGYTGNDSLYRFKKTFDMKQSFDYYIGKKIHLPDIYRKLQESVPFELAGDEYFPIYRHPSIQQPKLLKRA
ncbi:GNAT family N-acetyltransferase [Paenibacillus mesophilus]|uniref:GNAT family N-acetyltransferase n=1 Tax=Paenibacillus mesophilus TaxID=2582849 RepID=UPI0013051B5E|nr:GNAT family N-acetyltransferase [Paenibacillus mesophilus]